MRNIWKVSLLFLLLIGIAQAQNIGDDPCTLGPVYTCLTSQYDPLPPGIKPERVWKYNAKEDRVGTWGDYNPNPHVSGLDTIGYTSVQPYTSTTPYEMLVIVDKSGGPTLAIYSQNSDGKLIELEGKFTVYTDGHVVVAPGVELDAVSKEFWQILAKASKLF